MNKHGSLMPPEHPLSRPIQRLDEPYHDRTAPEVNRSGAGWWRLATFGPAGLTTLLLVAVFTEWFRLDGFSWFEGALISLIAFTFFWIALSVATATLGIATRIWISNTNDACTSASALDVALLVPIYNEVPANVFGNLAAMLEELQADDGPHRYTAFVLSDTRDEAIARRELKAVYGLRPLLPRGVSLYYRRREDNIDRKVGNLADWVERWGGGHTAMLVLDADSLMSGEAITTLTDALALDPSAGLIQSFPQLWGAQTLFGRVQQFSNSICGAALAEGLARWSDREGNYWGHNAIIRTRAFASCAGLPRVDTPLRKKTLILSHDFVEAGLLRRAGWAVRFFPRLRGSYEEVPATLIDYVLRDRRWCQGNLQHLSVLGSRGFHAVSRFHLFQGAMSYLLSPAWFALLVIWALMGNGEEANVVRYFSGSNPQVNWPEITAAYHLTILVFMYAMLLAPKLMGAGSISIVGVQLSELGGLRQFLMSFLTEVLLSVAYAPILMIQQTLAVLRTFVGVRENWSPQVRAGGRYGALALIRFHWLETVIGTLLVIGMLSGLVSLWLLPIAISLLLAIPLSALSGLNLAHRSWAKGQMGTPEVFNTPTIIRRAVRNRKTMRSILETDEPAIDPFSTSDVAR